MAVFLNSKNCTDMGSDQSRDNNQVKKRERCRKDRAGENADCNKGVSNKPYKFRNPVVLDSKRGGFVIATSIV